MKGNLFQFPGVAFFCFDDIFCDDIFIQENQFRIAFENEILIFQQTIMDIIRMNGSLRNFKIKPILQRDFEIDAVHIIEQRFLQSKTKLAVIDSCFIRKINVIISKFNFLLNWCHSKFFWINADRRVCCHCKLMPKTTLQNSHLEQLTNHFQRIDCFLNGLSRVAIHQISVNHNTSFGKITCDFGDLFYRNTFINQFQ